MQYEYITEDWALGTTDVPDAKILIYCSCLPRDILTKIKEDLRL
jgi:hypothetical protein